MSDINWRADDVVHAILDLMSAIERQDVFATLDITADVRRPKQQPEFIGTFFGTTRISERRVNG